MFFAHSQLQQRSALPGVPFLGLYTSDLFAIDSGNPDRDPDNDSLVNYQKLEMVAKVILDFERFKMSRFQIIPHHMLLDYIDNHLYILSEDDLYELSLKRESREANAELKQRLEKKERKQH